MDKWRHWVCRCFHSRPTVEQVFWSKDNVMVHSQVGKLILLEGMSLQAQALGLQAFPQEAPTMQ